MEYGGNHSQRNAECTREETRVNLRHPTHANAPRNPRTRHRHRCRRSAQPHPLRRLPADCHPRKRNRHPASAAHRQARTAHQRRTHHRRQRPQHPARTRPHANLRRQPHRRTRRHGPPRHLPVRGLRTATGNPQLPCRTRAIAHAASTANRPRNRNLPDPKPRIRHGALRSLPAPPHPRIPRTTLRATHRRPAQPHRAQHLHHHLD